MQELIQNAVNEFKFGSAGGYAEGNHVSALAAVLTEENIGELYRDDKCVLEAVLENGKVRPIFREL